MPDRGPPTRIPFPPSTLTGDLYAYLFQVARELNSVPTFSYTSYSGGPNSNLTGAPGDLVINLVASATTARLYVKEVGSSNTGWRSFQTM